MVFSFSKLVFIGALLLWACPCFTQETEKVKLTANYRDTPLTEVLTQLENRYGLTFSYPSASLVDKHVSQQFKDAGWEQISRFLTNRLGLEVRVLEGGYVSLVPLGVRDTRQWNICLGVRDEAGSPLPFVSVALVGSPQSFYTNDDGQARQQVTATASDSLELQFLGYQNLRLPLLRLTGEECPVFHLKPGGIDLSAIEVIEYLTDGVDASPEGRRVLIRPNKIAALPGFTENEVYRSLELLPGINSPDESAGGINIRGGSRDQTHVLWDGISVYPSGHLGGMISYFVPELVAEARVWRGQADANYGGRLSGVVALETEREVVDRIAAGASLNLTHANAYLKIPLLKDKSDLHLAARSSLDGLQDNNTFRTLRRQIHQGGLLTDLINEDFAGSESESNNQTADFREFNGRWQWNISPLSSLTASAFYQEENLAADFSEDIDTVSYQDLTEATNTGASLTWSQRFRSGGKLRLQAAHSSFLISSEAGFDQFTYAFFLSRNSSVSENNLRASFQKKTTPFAQLKTGVEIQLLDNAFSIGSSQLLDGILLDVQEFENNSSAALSAIAYFTYGWTGPGPLRAELGLRGHYYSLTDQIYPEPRLTASYLLNPSWTLKAGYGINHQFVSEVIELDPTQFGSAVPLWTLADGEDFFVPAAREFTLGLLGQGKGWLIDLEIYHKRIKNLSTLDRIRQEDAFDFSLGNARSSGIDLLLKKRWDSFRSWVIYTLSQSDWQFDELGSDFVPADNDRRHQLKWVGSYEAKRWLFSLGWRFHSGAPVTEPGVGNFVPDPEFPVEGLPIDFNEAFNNNRLANFHRLDFSVFYNWGQQDRERGIYGRIGLSALNLYGRSNTIGVTYLRSSGFDFNGEPITLWNELRREGLGFTPNLTLSIHWR